MSALKPRLQYYYAVGCLLCTSILLAGCGKKTEEQIAQEAIKKNNIMGLGFTGILMLLITACICIPSITKLIKSSQSQQRGTNAVTKFVRHSAGHGVQKRVLTSNSGVLAFDMIMTFIRFTIPKLLICLLPIGVIIATVKIMTASTKSKDRVQATRVTTKGAMQVGAATAKGVAVAGAVAAAPMTGGASLAAGAAVAGVAGAVLDETQKGMNVEGYRDINQQAITDSVAGGIGSVQNAIAQQATAKIAQIADTELFKQKAMRLGCNENMSLGEMAQVILKYAPEKSMRELPEGLSDEEKAVALLGAFKQQPKALPQREEPEAIEGEFREV